MYVVSVSFTPPNSIPKAFLRVFLRKEKGAASTGGDGEWKGLADEVNKYTSMASDDRDEDSHYSSEADTVNESEGRKDNEPIDRDIERGREQSDESLIDECEELVDRRESDSNDFLLEPISVAERREASVLFSKVRYIILL
jgi:hypothetical protein